MSRTVRGGGVLAAAACILVAGFAATFLPGPWGDESVSDLPLFGAYADVLLDGFVPYGDVSFEYPPWAAPLIALPGLAGTDEESYRLAFAALAFVLAIAMVALVGALAGRTGGDRRRALLAAAAAPLLCGAMIRTHFDLAPVVLTLGALLLLCADRPRTAMAVLGVAAATKLFPLVVAPVALAWLVARGERRAALDAAAAMALALVVAYGIALAISPAGTLDSLTYHLDRPVQVESSPAATLRGLEALGAGTAEPVHSHRSDGLEHPAAGLVTAAFTALLVGAVGLLAAGAADRRGVRPGPRVLVLASLASLVAFAVLGKVLSPQFLVWVVPLAALAFAWRMNALAAAATAAILLTLVEFPAHYDDVVAGAPAAVWLVVVRNAALFAVLVIVGWTLWTARPVSVEARGVGGHVVPEHLAVGPE